MYEPFPGNYVWNLSVNICIGMGGAIGEIDRANERVRDVAKQGDDAGTEAFFSAWMGMADRVAGLADEAAAAGHFLSAAEKYRRATAYYVTAERMQSRHYEPRKKGAHPGAGEALRMCGLCATADSKRWSAAALDYLETRKDVDHRFGMMGWSLG